MVDLLHWKDEVCNDELSEAKSATRKSGRSNGEICCFCERIERKLDAIERKMEGEEAKMEFRNKIYLLISILCCVNFVAYVAKFEVKCSSDFFFWRVLKSLNYMCIKDCLFFSTTMNVLKSLKLGKLG